MILSNDIFNKNIQGIPYIGGKSKIAIQILNTIIKHSRHHNNKFYDLFGGGGSISITASLFNFNVHYNEYDKRVSDCFAFLQENRINEVPITLITRNDFNIMKEKTDIISYLLTKIWSFSYNSRSYLWGKDKENMFSEIFTAIEKGDELYLHEINKKYNLGFNIPPKIWDNISDIIERWNILQNYNNAILYNFYIFTIMKKLRKLHIDKDIKITSLSYQDVKIDPNSIIYCDPPYNSKSNNRIYKGNFIHNDFYDWIRKKADEGICIYISEYAMPDDFVEIARFKKRMLLGNENSRQKNKNQQYEKLFVEKRFANGYNLLK